MRSVLVLFILTMFTDLINMPCTQPLVKNYLIISEHLSFVQCDNATIRDLNVNNVHICFCATGLWSFQTYHMFFACRWSLPGCHSVLDVKIGIFTTAQQLSKTAVFKVKIKL